MMRWGEVMGRGIQCSDVGRYQRDLLASTGSARGERGETSRGVAYCIYIPGILQKDNTARLRSSLE